MGYPGGINGGIPGIPGTVLGPGAIPGGIIGIIIGGIGGIPGGIIGTIMGGMEGMPGCIIGGTPGCIIGIIGPGGIPPMGIPGLIIGGIPPGIPIIGPDCLPCTGTGIGTNSLLSSYSLIISPTALAILSWLQMV